MNQQDIFASAQLLPFHPILKAPQDERIQYFVYLKKLIALLKWNKRKYTRAQLLFYKDILCGTDPPVLEQTSGQFATTFCYLLPYDVASITGYRASLLHTDRMEAISRKIIQDFSLKRQNAGFFRHCVEAAFGDPQGWNAVQRSAHSQPFHDYLTLARQNSDFLRQTPYRILLTATMSAGKSSLINALTGKNISRTQNMACTSKIHTIVAKPFEDGIVSEDDHDLLIRASRAELLEDSAANKSKKIQVSAYFSGELGGKRLILLDSPGVNASDNPEHARISQRMLKSRKYDLLVYVLNATQLGTTDEAAYLSLVRQQIKGTKILFVLNKADELLDEEEPMDAIIQRQRKFLQTVGFENPVICPLSAKAAYAHAFDKKKREAQEKLGEVMGL